MTEHDDSTNEDPITGKGPTNAGLTGKRSAHDDAAWFRAHVDPVIGDDVPDGWDEIQSRATGRQALMIPLPKAEVRAWPGRRLVAVAALLLVVVGMVGIGLKLVGSNDDDQIPAGGEDDHATGFYIPGTLPPGWTVTKLSMDSVIMVGIECPCDVTEIRRDDGDGGYVAQTSAESPPPRNSDEVRRYPLEGRSGWFEQGGDTGTVIWRTATGPWWPATPNDHPTTLPHRGCPPRPAPSGWRCKTYPPTNATRWPCASTPMLRPTRSPSCWAYARPPCDPWSTEASPP